MVMSEGSIEGSPRSRLTHVMSVVVNDEQRAMWNSRFLLSETDGDLTPVVKSTVVRFVL